MTKDEKNAVKLIVAVIILFGLMLYFSLSSCAAFKPLTIYVTSDTSHL